ncbi:MAG TPA: flagellar brake protein [Syntrophomonas sp.]|nr:flagellar brake protein [Syntrophomonas sp.]
MQKIIRSQVVKENAIQVNNRIEVALADDERKIFGHSLIQEVFDDSFSIMTPIYEGHSLNYRIDDEVIISVLINNVRYSFRTRVINIIKDINLRLLVLKMPRELQPADRRNLVRIKTLLPIKYKIIDSDQLDLWHNIDPDHETYLTNLSGNGLSISLEKSLLSGVIMVLNLNLGNGTEMKILGEVVRCEKLNKQYRIGIKFMDITERQEDLIISYVFQCLRKTIKLSRED